MFVVEKKDQDSTSYVTLTGDLSDEINLPEKIGELQANAVFNCKGITRINSVGAKIWIKFFHDCQAKGLQFRFVECPSAVVDFLNFIANFNCGGPVESILAPFACDECDNIFSQIYQVSDLKKIQFQPLQTPCTKCSKPAHLDEVQEEYLAFLNSV